MTKQPYNGWTNYETWAVNLWIDNDQGSQEFWREQAAEALRDAHNVTEPHPIFTPTEDATFRLADILKEDHETSAQGLLDTQRTPTVLNDLLNAALSEVNWKEIAEHLIERHNENVGSN